MLSLLGFIQNDEQLFRHCYKIAPVSYRQSGIIVTTVVGFWKKKYIYNEPLNFPNFEIYLTNHAGKTLPM